MIFNKTTRLAILGFSLFAFSYGADNDGRPEYMKFTALKDSVPTHYFNKYSYNLTYYEFKGGNYSPVNNTIPILGKKESFYAFDFVRQRSDLKMFYEGPHESYKTQNVPLHVYSKQQSSNPEVVLYLHGSSGQDLPIIVDKILESGLAMVTFHRFSSEETSKGLLLKQSWNDQTEIPLNAEVMMVYGVCKRLVELGTKVIHLAGHSRGGTLTLECAKEFNAQHFRRIVSGTNEGGVVSYTPISAMPVFMERALTDKERVNIFHGRYDTICSYSLMEYYYRPLKGQRNVQMIPGNFGHLPWEAETTLKGTLFQLVTGLWNNKFSPRGLLRTDANFVKNMWYLVSGRQWFLTWHFLPAADNFNNACVEIEGDNFRPVFPKRRVITRGVTRDISGLSGYLKSMITKGVWSSELPTSASEEQGRIARIVDIIVTSAANLSAGPVGGAASLAVV